MDNKNLCESCKWQASYKATQDHRVFFENCSQCYFDGEYTNYEKVNTNTENIKK